MIVGLNGFKGSGKDTVADILCEKYGFQKKGFATKLKQSVGELFQISQNEIENWKNDPSCMVVISDIARSKTMSFRTFLQRYGTESHRAVFGDNFWVDNAFADLDLTQNLVFPDCRFINEINKIKEYSGVIVQIERPSVESDGHASEIRPPEHLIDIFLKNDGTLEDLKDAVDSLVDELKYTFPGSLNDV